jgi:hypothetical protein
MTTDELLVDKAECVRELANDLIRCTNRQDYPDALAAARRLAETATSTLTTTVVAAKEHGATWQHIGDELGVTRQAAQQRYLANT